MSAIFWQFVVRHWRGLLDTVVFVSIASSALFLLTAVIAWFAERNRPKSKGGGWT